MTLATTVTEITKMLWSAGITSPVDYIEQLGLLMALHELPELPVPLRWAAWRELDAPAMLATVRDQVVPAALARLNGQGTLFQDLAFLIGRSDTLAQIVERIDDLPWADGRADLLGDAFECLLAQMQETGVHGQFRTPGHIARFLVQALDPQPGETVWDPACGTGTLLLEAIRCCPRVGIGATRSTGGWPAWRSSTCTATGCPWGQLPSATRWPGPWKKMGRASR